MATASVIYDGPRNLIVRVIGGASDDTAAQVTTIANLSPTCTRIRLDKIYYDVATGVTVSLLWDATTNKEFLTVTEGNGQHIKFKKYGGLHNDAGAGATGNVLITTTGITSAPSYSLILEFVKTGTIGVV